MACDVCPQLPDPETRLPERGIPHLYLCCKTTRSQATFGLWLRAHHQPLLRAFSCQLWLPQGQGRNQVNFLTCLQADMPCLRPKVLR